MKYSEWIFLSIIIGIFGLFGALSYFRGTSFNVMSEHSLRNPQMIKLHVEGAVKNPGVFEVMAGTDFKVFMLSLQLDENADIDALINKKFHKSKTLIIKKKKSAKTKVKQM